MEIDCNNSCSSGTSTTLMNVPCGNCAAPAKTVQGEKAETADKSGNQPAGGNS